MEDFRTARADESNQTTALQAEWMDNLKPNIASNNADIYLSFAANASDKQEPVKEKNAAPENSAEKLDKDLRAFADTPLFEPSRDLLKFQKAVGKFCDASDKEAAMDDLGETWTNITSLMNIKSEALFRERKEVANNTPGRKELEANHKAKQDQLWDKVMKLPLGESFRIQDLLMRQPGETKAQQDERIRKGLANNKPILDAYNEIGAAEAKIEANKGPREKQLQYLEDQLDTDAATMNEQLKKAYLRSTLK